MNVCMEKNREEMSVICLLIHSTKMLANKKQPNWMYEYALHASDMSPCVYGLYINEWCRSRQRLQFQLILMSKEALLANRNERERESTFISTIIIIIILYRTRYGIKNTNTHAHKKYKVNRSNDAVLMNSENPICVDLCTMENSEMPSNLHFIFVFYWNG